MKHSLFEGQADKPHTERWAYRWFYTDQIFRLTTALYPICGRAFFHRATAAVAGFYTRTQPGIVDVVRRNLSLLGKEADQATARRVFINFSRVIADYVAVGAMRGEAARGLCAEFVGREHIEESLGSGKGAILATGHLGFFEYGCVVLGSMGASMAVATKPEPTAALTGWRANWRRRWGVETIEVGEDPFSSLAVNRALSEGRMVAVLADRPLPGHGVPFSLPGGKTLLSSTPATLSAMSGAPVIPVAVTLRSDGFYRVAAMPPHQAQRTRGADRRREIEHCTQAMGRSLFTEIAAHPDQWFQFVPIQCA